MTSMAKLRILVSAYGCEPNKGSEAGVGWNWVEIMARHYELWVVTRKNNKENIDSYIAEDIKKNIHFIYYDLPDKIRALKKKEKGLYWYYYLWQRGIMHVIKDKMETINFDYVMHLTFGSIWLPTYLHRLKVPFIWGPVGGGEAVPNCYLKKFAIKSKAAHLVRNSLIKLKKLNVPLISRCKKAAFVIARTYDTAEALPYIEKKKSAVMLETAISHETLAVLDNNRRPMQNETIKIIYTGRLIPLKAVDMAINAVALSKYKEKIEFTIVGRGPEEERLKKIVQEKNLEKKVQFIGEISREEVLERLKNADIFLFPSLKEGGTWALMEAMAAGLPSICINTSGMRIITDDSSAIRIPIQTIENTVLDMAKAIDLLISDPAYAVEMGKNARHRIEKEFTWDAKDMFIQNVIDSMKQID